MGTIHLASARAQATVSTTAGMLVDAHFDVDGRRREPFARAPWITADGLDGLPAHLRMLGAEFVAVPFGSSARPAALAEEWDRLIPAEPPTQPHGHGANGEWLVVARGADWVTLAIDYPLPDDISRLERTIRLRSDSAAIDFELIVSARRSTRTAIGLHPILRLPAAPGDLELLVEFDRGFSYPGRVWPEAGATEPARTFDSLDCVAAPGGHTVDLSRLPLGAPAEDVLLLAGVTGPVTAKFHDDCTTLRLDWDRAILPSLLLWLSDRALQERPWSGTYRALGVEPIAAAFDFDNSVSVAANPLNLAGYSTAVDVPADMPVHIRYSIEVGSHSH